MHFACRAMQDALHHSSIVLFKSLGIDHREMRVQVTIGVQDPEQDTTHVIATAAIAAFLPIEDGAWRLSDADG